MVIGRTFWLPVTVLMVLLTGACSGAVRGPLFIQAGPWPQEIKRIALVELSFDRRYRPPPQSYLVAELRRTLQQQLAAKGYSLLIADRGEEIYERESPPAELLARSPAGTDAVLALHIDFLALPATLSERNPPPQADIAGEARLLSSQGKELWRDRGNGVGGGTGALPVFNRDALRQAALTDLVEELFATLPGRR